MSQLAFLSGSAAIARGAWEAGASFAAGFPGDPATPMLHALEALPGLDVQWTPNEKVALEVALGMAQGGRRALAVMKHIGLNIAADSLITSAYSGVRAGLVIVSVDDPGLLSSLNEQDTRHFARAAKLLMLAPSSPAEAQEFVTLAFALSEQHDIPVLVRMTTRLSHTRGVCRLSEPTGAPAQGGALKSPVSTGDGLRRHAQIEKVLAAVEQFGNQAFELNTVDVGSPEVGIITSGISYAYSREALPGASFLKLGMIHPLPHKLIAYFASLVKRLYVVEELDPFLEEQIRAMGITVTGKEVFPRTGELSPDTVARGLAAEGAQVSAPLPFTAIVPPRASQQCLGCAHRGLMNVFQKLQLRVVGDVGCFQPGELPPVDPKEIEACFCIGSSMSVAYGRALAQGEEAVRNTVAVISGSTFMHSGLPALANIVQNGGTATVCILVTPGTHESAPAPAGIDFAKLCEGVGVSTVRAVHPDDEEQIERALREELPRPGVSVLLSRN
jgi:indolepyruvate ferredoxin oxidoreductase, alpha subunit